MNIAKVVIDVAAAAIDSLFDYQIPEHLEGSVQPGVRVIVPFGPRKVMGFVTELTDESEFDQLKEIIEVMDHTPILTNELLQLSKWLQEETLCYRISAMQAMLPAAFKAKYKKEVWLLGEESEYPELWQRAAAGREVFPFEELENYEIPSSQVTKMVQDGLIDIKYIVKEKNRVKTDTYVTLNLDPHELLETLENFGYQAKKQRMILEHFEEAPEPIRLKELLHKYQTNRSTVDQLVKKNLVKLIQKEIYRDPYQKDITELTDSLPLTGQQQKVIEPIHTSIDENRHEVFLLHGITGSGKTEIYLQSIERVLSDGKEAIVLVPEISLTPQMVTRFKERFGGEVAVLHSALSQGEKYDEWRKIQRKEVSVVVGARSAVFAPFENLGIIIIDEEHETSYKQEDYPKYHAREVAKYRGRAHDCPVVLGSATPTLESYARASKGVYTLLELTERVNARPLPEMEIIDMRKELEKGNRSMFSESLAQKIQDRLDKNEQVVLLLNRRGYSSFVMCRECGETIQCEHCDISMTYHRKQNKLKCHYCNAERWMPQRCPNCESEAIRFFGTGTQKIEEALHVHFEEARVIRMDVDTTSKKGSHEKLLDQFGRGDADILLGTQMIAKGLDFKNVTLVGVIAADSMLHLPDFRASERSFQLLTQVSGRAGRHDLPGEVVVQTYTPEHYSVVLASDYDFEGFFNREMKMRKQVGYPPYFFMVLINLSHENHVRVNQAANEMAKVLSQHLSEDSILLGPTPSPMLRIKDRYRYQCLIKYKRKEEVDFALRNVLDHFKKEVNQNKLSLTIDFDPYYFM